MEIIRCKDYKEMSEKAYFIYKERIENLIKEKNKCTLGLATGSTPLGLYELLRNSDIDFSKIDSYNLDEYVGISQYDKNSYHFFMHDNLFKYINIHRWYVPNGDAFDLEYECERYSKEVLNANVDIQLLGVGENGHIGFNEPYTSFDSTTHIVDLTESTINANSRLFSSIEEVPVKAITMGIKEIMSASCVVMLASGAKKSDAIKALVEEEVTLKVPCSILKTHKNFILIADEEALCKLKDSE